MIKYIFARLFRKLSPVALKNSSVHKLSKVEAGSSFINSTMNKHSFCGYNCDINHTDIGSFCSIANGVIIGGGMHPLDWVSTSPVFYAGRDSVKAKFSEYEREPIKRVKIGHDVWVGQNVIVKQGVTIGNGAVIGMGSVVTKDVEPYTIVAGCPARVIKQRFSDVIIAGLERTQWWMLDEEQLKCVADKIKDPGAFLDALLNKQSKDSLS